VLEAAKKVVRQSGYSKLSPRDVAAAAGAPLSQIHYHFGSKPGMVLALFEYLNAQLLDRQGLLFDDVTLKVSEQWDRVYDYLDEDIASGYVRILQELIAASWADPAIGKVVRAGLLGWSDAVRSLAWRAERELRGLGPFSSEELRALIGSAFLGAESTYLLGLEKRGVPARQGRHDLKSLHFRIAATDPLGKILNAPPKERRDFRLDFGR
jgi:AcrR family transcriptional regulator